MISSSLSMISDRPGWLARASSPRSFSRTLRRPATISAPRMWIIGRKRSASRSAFGVANTKAPAMNRVIAGSTAVESRQPGSAMTSSKAIGASLGSVRAIHARGAAMSRKSPVSNASSEPSPRSIWHRPSIIWPNTTSSTAGKRTLHLSCASKTRQATACGFNSATTSDSGSGLDD